MIYTDEQIKQANNASIEDFARSQGIYMKRVGNGAEYQLPEYGNSLYINTEKNVFNWFAHDIHGGGALSFAQRVLNMSFLDAMRYIVGNAEEKANTNIKSFKAPSEPVNPPKKEFVKPEKSDNFKRLYTYFIQERKLSADTVNLFVKANLLYQGKVEYTKDGEVFTNDNAVFLRRDKDGNETGAMIQGLSSEKRFKRNMGDFADFNFTKGENPDKVYLFEAPIDLMSFVELHPEIDNAIFTAMGGLQPKIAQEYMDAGYTVISCVDNDEAGRAFNDRIVVQKMEEVWAGKSERSTYSDRKPPIEFLKAENGGRTVNLFLTKEDCDDYSRLSGKKESAFVFRNRSSFQPNYECKIYNVKDFNDLLKKKKALGQEFEAIKDTADHVTEVMQDRGREKTGDYER